MQSFAPQRDIQVTVSRLIDHWHQWTREWTKLLKGISSQ
uniref:Uncharacterized protein n=1 Tax=Arundo donax TaxID=35708 RepID=A0A0A9AHV4_ARUDO